MNESDLQRDLDDGDDAVDDVKLVRKVGDVCVEGAGDDGEDHVQEREDRSEAEQLHVLNNVFRTSKTMVANHFHL